MEQSRDRGVIGTRGQSFELGVATGHVALGDTPDYLKPSL